MQKKNLKKIIYDTFTEYRELPKIEIVKKAAQIAGVTVSKIWHELEKKRIASKDIEYIIDALRIKTRKPAKIAEGSPENKEDLSETAKNLEAITDTIPQSLANPADSVGITSTEVKNVIAKPKKPSREKLEELYLKEGWDTDRIARKYQRTRGTIYVWLREFNIPKKIISTKRPRNLGKPKKDELYKEYVEEKKSIDEMAKLHSAGRTSVRRWLKQYGIPLRTLSEELLKNKRQPSKDELEELYINKQMSIKKIAHMYNMSKRVIKRFLINFNIPIRSYEDSLSLAALKGKKAPTEEELYNLYIKKGKSIDEIAKTYGLSHPPIIRLFKKYGIKTRTLKQALRLRIKKKIQEDMEKFEIEKYKGLRGLVGLFGLAMEDEEARRTLQEITSGYLYKLRNLCETLGSENIEGEILLIAKHDKNKLEPLLIKCLYKASVRYGINVIDINEDSSEFEVLQRFFFDEIRKEYIKYASEMINNNNSNNTNKINNVLK
ncbi:MAG: hypothetical protein ACPLXC_02380 [Candidatus Pacearchaeota archaeon]